MLEIKNLYFGYERGVIFKNKKLILNNVNLKIKENDTYFLIGESASGKSTLAKLILGILKPIKGDLFFENKLIDFHLKKHKLSFRRKIQYIPQHPETFFNFRYSILDHILEIRHIHRDLVINKKEIEKYLKKFCLKSNCLEKYPHELSGGELQRILIIRALLLRPKFIIFDESFSMLDILTQAIILEFLLDIKKEHNLTYLFITHDLDIVKVNFPNKIVGILFNGKILEENKNFLESAKYSYTKELIKKFYFKM